MLDSTRFRNRRYKAHLSPNGILPPIASQKRPSSKPLLCFRPLRSLFRHTIVRFIALQLQFHSMRLLLTTPLEQELQDSGIWKRMADSRP